MPVTNRAFILLVGIIATILVGWVLHVGAAILQPLVIALLLASLLSPLVTGLARLKIPPALTVIAIAASLLYGAVRVGFLIQANIQAFLRSNPSRTMPGPPIPGAQAPPDEAVFAADAPERGIDLSFILENIEERLRESERLPEPVVTGIIDWIGRIDVGELARNVAEDSLGFVRSLFLVILYMVFIFAEQAVFKSKILSVAGERKQDAAKVLDTLSRGIQRYLGVKTIASIATGAICYLALVLLEVPYAMLFGILTVLLNYIPTFGSIIAAFPPMATAFAVEDGGLTLLAVVGLIYISVNTLIGSYLEPKVLGRELNLSPLVIIVAVVIWGGLWGVVGAFLAVPIMATVQIVLYSMYTTRPLAVLLSSGPPRDERKRIRRLRRRREAS